MPQFRRYPAPGHCYFVTTTVHRRRPLFRDRRLSQILIDNLRFYRDHMGFQLHGYVIMPDHLHLLITPGATTVSEIMRNFKSFASKQIGEAIGVEGPIWQRRFYDRVIRDEEQFLAALNYIHLNPVKSGLVASPEEYEFSSYRAYAGLGHSPVEMDSPDRSRLGP